MIVNLSTDIRLELTGKVTDYFMKNSNWDISGLETSELWIILIYFTFTSLSTVGFGDYYPVSEAEQVLGAFMLLSGVATFSYILGELNTVLLNVISNDDELDYDELDKFYALLYKFNNSQPISGDIMK